MLFGIPRSSRWLVTTNRTDEALNVLELMGSPNSKAELQEIIDSVHMERGMKQEPVWNRKYAFPIFLAISIGLLNQLSGINAILYYSNFIFASAGFGSLSSGFQTVLVGLVNLLATLLGMSLIDKLGRKTLLLVGSVGMVFTLAAVAQIFHSNTHQSLLVWMLMIYILFFAISQGSVIWVYIAEVFPNRVRSKGQSIGCSAHWISAALITLYFPRISAHSTAAPFAFFAAMMTLQFILVLAVFPETRGITLEQLQHKLGIA